MSTLNGRICIVTGAAQGIGKGIAQRLVADGATVVVADLNGEAAAETAAELGNDSIGVTVDISDRTAVDAMVAQAKEKYGRIDVLVNNAGWDKVGPFLDLEPDVWDRIININLYGTLHCSQAAARVMVEQEGGGTIINIGSDAARVGSSGEAVYSACKGGVVSFTKTLARELARYGVTANAVCPGPADTPLFAQISEENPSCAPPWKKRSRCVVSHSQRIWPTPLLSSLPRKPHISPVRHCLFPVA